MKKILVIAAVAGAWMGVMWMGGAALAALPNDGANGPLSAGVFDEDTHEMVSEETYPFEPGGIVDVDSDRAAISVAGWDEPEAQVVITRSLDEHGGFFGLISGGRVSAERAKELLQRAKVETTAGEGALRVRSHFTDQHSEPKVRLQIEVRVPRATALRLATDNGRISVKDIDATLDVRTQNGELVIERVAGVVRARTDNGRVQLASIQGDINAGTSNGQIVCDSVTGAVQLSTDNGAIETRRMGGGALVCHTSNGAIDVMLDRGDALNLDMETGQGSLKCNVPLDSPSDRSERQVRGTLRGGGDVVSLHSGNGAITVGEE